MCGVMIIESRRKGDGDLWWRERGRRAWTPDKYSICKNYVLYSQVSSLVCCWGTKAMPVRHF